MIIFIFSHNVDILNLSCNHHCRRGWSSRNCQMQISLSNSRIMELHLSIVHMLFTVQISSSLQH